jgi:putative peptidoglycan lipid II flippase
MSASDKPAPRSRLLSTALIVGLSTMASRITGFGRDIFLAALLGAGPFSEIFVIAFRLPNLFRRLFAEGAFSAAFVPLFSQQIETNGTPAAIQFAARVCSVLLTAVVVFTLLAQIFMPGLVMAIAQGMVGAPEKFDLAVYYARISFPYLIFMSLMALFAAMLNATGRFFAAAFAPLLLNILLILAMAMAVVFQGLAIDYIIWGVVISGFAQLAFVVIAVWRAGLGFRLAWPRWTADVKAVFALAVPGMLAAGIGQINLLVGTSIATAQIGAVAWLYYADRLYQLPMGVVGVALSVALLPDLSRRLAAGDDKGARDSQNLAVLAAMGLTLPAAGGLSVLAAPIVSILFERGAFTAADTLATARAAQAFCLGLPAFVLVKALQPSFFARQDTRAPLVDGAIGVAFNIAVSLTLFPIYGHVAIAYATSLAGWVTLLLMLLRMARRSIWTIDFDVARMATAQLAATALMVAALIWAGQAMAPPSNGLGLGLWVAVMVVGGGVVFGVAAWLLGGINKRQLHRLRRR